MGLYRGLFRGIGLACCHYIGLSQNGGLLGTCTEIIRGLSGSLLGSQDSLKLSRVLAWHVVIDYLPSNNEPLTQTQKYNGVGKIGPVLSSI